MKKIRAFAFAVRSVCLLFLVVLYCLDFLELSVSLDTGPLFLLHLMPVGIILIVYMLERALDKVHEIISELFERLGNLENHLKSPPEIDENQANDQN